MTLSRNVLLYGAEMPLPERIPLRAGPLSLEYENGDLRTIRLGRHEIVRRLYVAIRDHNWGTALPQFANVKIEADERSFRIRYDVECKLGDIDFFWQGEITGQPDGTIRFVMDGVARSTFRRNRIGFCVLHPMDLAGSPCRVVHVGGSHDEAQFPLTIAPQFVINGEVKPVIPFNEMAAMIYPLTEGVEAEIRFEGDIFEMEDQRNWTDASYKTYCTPLRLPFPAQVAAGTRVRQAITLRLKGQISDQAEAETGNGLILKVSDGPATPLPAIGLGCASHGQALSEREIIRLRALHLSHLRVDLHLSQVGWAEKLGQASVEAQAIGAGLEAALFLSAQAEQELAELVVGLQAIQPPVKQWLIFHEQEKVTASPWVQMARRHLSAYDPAIPVGAGTNIFFTELNRDRPDAADLDLVAYSLNPQVHAFDNLSLVETLAAQATTVTSARSFVAETPLAVSPVTLKMRFNPSATGPEAAPEPGQLPPQVDPRQMSLFGAGWTLGSLKYLAGSDVQSLTYYETTGWRGVMETEAGSSLPRQFHSLPGGVFPLYHVFADLGDFAGGEMLPVESSNPLLVEGLALRKGDRWRLLIANLSNDPQEIALSGLPARLHSRSLDETNAFRAMTSPEEFRAEAPETHITRDGRLALTLRPYGLMRLDS